MYVGLLGDLMRVEIESWFFFVCLSTCDYLGDVLSVSCIRMYILVLVIFTSLRSVCVT